MKRFEEDYNSYVFTTKDILSGAAAILHVSHDIEGDWQFLEMGNVSESDARVVSLGEIVELDSTVLEVADLPVGSVAVRDDRNSSWKIV